VCLRGKSLLTEADLARHFRAAGHDDILGLHTTSPEHLSRWLAVDIDQHGPGGNDAEANLAVAPAWYERRERWASGPFSHLPTARAAITCAPSSARPSRPLWRSPSPAGSCATTHGTRCLTTCSEAGPSLSL
jgi:hypothetical protein